MRRLLFKVESIAPPFSEVTLFQEMYYWLDLQGEKSLKKQMQPPHLTWNILHFCFWILKCSGVFSWQNSDWLKLLSSCDHTQRKIWKIIKNISAWGKCKLKSAKQTLTEPSHFVSSYIGTASYFLGILSNVYESSKQLTHYKLMSYLLMVFFI